MKLDNLPHFPLGHWPTPLEEWPRLAAALDGPRIFSKRDDLTGLALGGNKCRKLEYLMGDALRRGIDALITTGGEQSNFAVQLSAASRKAGLEPCCLLFGEEPRVYQGNLILHRILGTRLEFTGRLDPKAMLNPGPQLEDIAEKLRRNGRRPMVIPAGGSTPTGIAGWVAAGEEIRAQCATLGIIPGHAVVATGTGGNQAGLVLGFRLAGLRTTVLGVSVMLNMAEMAARVAALAADTATLLELPPAPGPKEIAVLDEYIGPGYGIPSPACLDAIRLVAQTEGVFLDPIYSGKAMAGLIDLARSGRLTRTDTVLFIHTGGVAADFLSGVFR